MINHHDWYTAQFGSEKLHEIKFWALAFFCDILGSNPVCNSLDMSSAVRILSIKAGLLSCLSLNLDKYLDVKILRNTRWVLQTWMLLTLAIIDLRWSKLPFLPRRLHHNHYICSNTDNCLLKRTSSPCSEAIIICVLIKIKVVHNISQMQIVIKRGENINFISPDSRGHLHNGVY